MTVQQATKQLVFQLFHLYDEREAANIADLVMENITEWKRINRVLNKEVPLSPEKETLLAAYLTELTQHKPVQYVLNEAWFYGMKLYVDERVLIPRPETEELVRWIVQEIKALEAGNRSLKEQEISILDIGTGSGCIAIGLKKNYPSVDIIACDVSEPALEVAKKNALANETDVSFIQCDFLNRKESMGLQKADIIVSNPPYIPENNKTAMHPNVLEHEPALALFVPDHDPLVFYKAIADFAQTHLKKQGAVFVEIHEQMGSSITRIFADKGFERIEIRKDLQEKERMIKASLQ